MGVKMSEDGKRKQNKGVRGRLRCLAGGASVVNVSLEDECKRQKKKKNDTQKKTAEVGSWEKNKNPEDKRIIKKQNGVCKIIQRNEEKKR